MNKLGYSYREFGRLTFKQFEEDYEAYKQIFDTELLMIKVGCTYEKLESETLKENIKDEEEIISF